MVNWVDYVTGNIDVEIWLRISTNGEYLSEEYLDKRELREYMLYYVEEI